MNIFITEVTLFLFFSVYLFLLSLAKFFSLSTVVSVSVSYGEPNLLVSSVLYIDTCFRLPELRVLSGGVWSINVSFEPVFHFFTVYLLNDFNGPPSLVIPNPMSSFWIISSTGT